jgi:tRNA modification GTPase
VVLQALLGACLDAGARLAQPGEFTRRAFLEGKLDLAQAEAVADLIDAASQQAARSAMRSLQGEFSSAVDRLRLGLVELRALTEAGLDFPEEEIDAAHGAELSGRLASLRAALDELRGRSRQGALLRDGLHVVLAGRPNVGKSSLLNRLLGEERAIVTPVPGTTRDMLREALHIEGVPLVLVDTAGLRESDDSVERIGIERSRRALEDADIVLAVLDASDVEAPAALPATALRVYNKIDLVPGFRPPPGALGVSARTGDGLDALRRAILQAAGWSSTGETAFLARARHLRALDEAANRLQAAAAQVTRTELFAEELRLAQVALGTVTGREFTADDLLGEIFSRFCIGK